jgi:uncharacterized protein YndB with AHSA1/START domain
MTIQTDQISKSTVLRAPLERVWQALSDARQFGTWFGAEFDGGFVPGTRLTGRMMPTAVDAEVAKMQEPYAGMPFVIVVERVEPMRLLSFRWHPYPVEPKDYEREPMTLVEFQLKATPQGTEVTVTESGFEGIPLERRAKAFTANDEGWTHQMSLIAKYLARPE